MTNQDFIDEVFGAAPGVFTVAFEGDPAVSREYGFNPDTRDLSANNFAAVSIFHRAPDGSYIRKREYFRELRVVVVDDVVSKVPVGAVISLLGEPTWIIETSPENFQYGYKLDEPVTDVNMAEGIIEALGRQFTGDMAGVNRLFRLPRGSNGKAKYGEPSPHTHLIYFCKGRTISTKGLISDLSAVPTETPAGRAAFLPLLDDPVIQAMDLDDHPWGETSTPGTYDVRCPWVDQHTDGRDDGSAYIAPAGFKCHHGHCQDKTFKDFREFLNLSAEEIDKAMDAASVEAFIDGEDGGPKIPFGKSPGTAGTTSTRAGSSTPGTPPKPSSSRASKTSKTSPRPSLLENSSVQRFHIDETVMDAKELQKFFPRQWIFKDLVTANGVFLLAGQGGLGKSRLAMALAMSAASGLPWGPFVPENPDGVRTMLLTQEDDDAEKGHRYTTQLRWMQKIDSRWGDADTMKKLENHLYLPEIDPSEGLSKKLLLELKQDQEANGPYQFMIWDPLILFWQGEDDQGLNSAAGARDTINALSAVNRKPCKAAGLPYSVGIVHHLNKAGTVMGSVMVENLTRTVFKLERDEAAEKRGETRGMLKIDKANGIALRDGEVPMYLETPAAVVHFKGGFAKVSRNERVADALTSGAVAWDAAEKDLITALERVLPILGETKTERCAVLKDVFTEWKNLDPEVLEVLGLEREETKAKIRYRPIV